MRTRHTQALAEIRAVPSKTLVNRTRMKVVNIASTNFFAVAGPEKSTCRPREGGDPYAVSLMMRKA